MAISRLPRHRGLVGMVALIGALLSALLLGATSAQALDTVTPSLPSVVPTGPSVVPTAQSAVPAGAAAAIPQSPAAAVPPAAANAIPSSAAAAVPPAAEGAAIASHVLAETHVDPADPPTPGSSPGPATGSNPSTGATQPVTPAQAIPQGIPPTAAGPTLDRAGSTSTSDASKTSSTGAATATHRRRPPGAPGLRVPPPTGLTASAPRGPAPRGAAPAIDLSVHQAAPRAAHATADVHKLVGTDRRSRSPRPAAVDPSTPGGGLLGASGSLPLAGAGASSSGTGVGSPAASLLTLVAVCLLGALLPGLLGLDIGPWRSTLHTLRLERPG
jgi:hypothetical protein